MKHSMVTRRVTPLFAGVVWSWCLAQGIAAVPVTNGLALWYDAGAVATNAGAVVAQWDDLSGNGRHGTPLSPTNGPVFVTNVVNGLSALRFDGVDDKFDYDGTFLTNTDYTVFCVEARNSNKNNNYLFGGSVSVVNNNLHLGYRTDVQFTHAHWGNDYNTAIPAFSNKQFKVHSWQFDRSGGSGRATYTDGALLGFDANTTALITYPGAMVGGRRTAERFEGDFAEVIMYDRYLGEADRNKVGYYLGEKYGIAHAYVDPGAADIAVSVAPASAAVVSIGGAVDYAVTVRNDGFTNATAVVVSNAIPAGLDFVSASGGAYSNATGEWHIGDLPYLATTTLTVRATANASSAGTAISIAAGVQSAGEDDPDPANNMDSITVRVRDEIDPADFPTKMRIEFPGYDRAETLTNFPALIVLNESIPGFDYDLFASSEGYDLRFVATNGTTVLNHDVDIWHSGGDSLLWVQVDALSTGAYIHAYWGNASLTTPPASTTNGTTWADGFAGVWHLGESGASDDALDAGPGAHHGATTGTPTTVTGVVAGGRGMFGDALFDTGDGVDLSGGPFTVSAWVNRAIGLAGDNMWAGGGIPSIDHGLHLGFRNQNLYFGLFTDDASSTNAYPDDRGAWHYYSMVLDEAHGKQIYRDGVPVGTTGATNDFYQSAGLLIGGTYAGFTFRGELDELRASTVDRSDAWVWAEWMTVTSNDTFTTYNEVFGLPVIDNIAPSGVTDVSAFANADLVFTGAAPTTVTLLWGETDGGAGWGSWDHTNVLGPRTAGALSTLLTNLTVSTGYAYTYYASNSYGEAWAAPSIVFSTRSDPYWTITPSAGPNGTISPSIAETVDDNGSSSIFTFAGDTGHHLTNLLVDGVLVGPTNMYQFTTVTSNHSIHALFGLNDYTVTAQQAANGLISPTNPIVVSHGSGASYTFEPADGYFLEDVLVGGLSAGPLEAYTIASVTGNVTVTAVFSELPMEMSTDGLVLWLDGSRLSQPQGSLVEAWPDYSGRGNDAVQTNLDFGPRYYDDTLGPHVYFAGAPYMRVMNESDFDFTTEATIILVGDHTTGGAWTPFISKHGEGAQGGWQLREGGTQNVLSFTTRGVTGGGEDDPFGTGDIRTGSVLAGRYDGSTLTKQLWYNGALDGTLTYTGGQIRTNDLDVILGARDQGGSIAGQATCDIYELFVYDTALTDAELNAVGYYLAEKYGIAHDYLHPREPTLTASKSPARTMTSALLQGTLVSTGAAPTSVWAYWDRMDQGTSNRLAWAGSTALGMQAQGGTFSVDAADLRGDTDYVCRFFASNAYGTAWSDAMAFESGIIPDAYTNSLKLSFTGYAGTTTLTNFPALVALSSAVTNFSYPSFASALGGDLRFTDADVEWTLNYEVENWVPALMNQDIGAVGAAGGLSISGPTYTVSGSGADIWDTVDEFHFAYRPLAGDGAITARVRSIDNPGNDEWCKSGVMIRENLFADTRHVMVLARPDGQTTMQWRDAAGSNALNVATVPGPVPGWLRLERVGDTFTGYVSSNGVDWVLRSTQTVAMATNVLIGLAVTSHSDGNVSAADFDNVTFDVGEASHVWVQVPRLASSNDCIWAFWGNPARTAPPLYSANGCAWSEDFGAVWHMTEPDALDSTVNANDGTAGGNLDAAGLIAGAQTFTNAGSLAVNTGIDLRGRSFTFETWSKRSAIGDEDYFCGQGTSGADNLLHIGFRNTGVLTLAFYSDDLNIPGPWNDTTNWHHWACVHDAATRRQEVYRDGVSIGSRTAIGEFAGSGTFHIGARAAGVNVFQGEMDEVRLSNLPLSQDWVRASYSNQVVASTFITYSDERPILRLPALLLIVR